VAPVSQLRSRVRAEVDKLDKARVYWAYCATGLQMLLLRHFQLTLEQTSLEGEAEATLAVSEGKPLRLVFELIIALGLQPLLQKGVGIPLTDRVRQHVAVSGLIEPAKNPLGSVLTYLRVLIECSASGPLCQLFFDQNLADILGAVLQTVHLDSETSIAAGGAAVGAVGAAASEQQQMESEPQPESSARVSPRAYMDGAALLREIQSLISPQIMLETLMVLSGRRCNDAPAWLRRACFAHMTRVITEEGGVVSLYAVLLRVALVTEGMPTHMAVGVLWQQCQRAAVMLASNTAPGMPSVEAFFALVSPQGACIGVCVSVCLCVCGRAQKCGCT
jgi:hypothetical protein